MRLKEKKGDSEIGESLQKIANAVKAQKEARIHLGLALIRYKEAKVSAREADDELGRIVEGETENYPLFPRIEGADE